MKNVIKLTLVLLTSLSLGFSANAGELSVSGTAKATYNIMSGNGGGAEGGNNLGKGLGIANELNFTAAGELDNGYSWNYSMELDPSSATATPNDDTKLTLTTPYGKVGIYISEGGLDKNLKFSPAAYTAGIDVGIGATINPIDLGAYNSFQYHTTAGLLPFATVISAGFAPSADTGGASSSNSQGVVNSATNTYTATVFTAGTADSRADFAPDAVSSVAEYSVTTAPIDGLEVNASYTDMSSSLNASGDSTNEYEAGALTAKYSVGPFTVGAGRTLVQPYSDSDSSSAADEETVQYVETNNYGVGYAINEALSVSYEKSKSEAFISSATVLNVKTRSKDSQDMTSIQAAYTMGGMTMALSQTEVDGDGYTKEETVNRIDVKETIFAITMAF